MDTLRLEQRADETALITFDRPESLNSMSPRFCEELLATLDGIAADRSVRVVILTGAGRGFSSGHDLGDLRPGEAGPRSIPELLEQQELYANVIRRIQSIPQPVIAAVNGPAAGGGLNDSTTPDGASGSDRRGIAWRQRC